jgi:hypothetical protein
LGFYDFLNGVLAFKASDHGEADYRILFEIVVRGVNPKSFEKLAVTLHEFREGANQKRFSETGGTGKKIASSIRDHFVKVSRFVYIKEIAPSDLGETLTGAWKFQHDFLLFGPRCPVASNRFWFIAFQKRRSKANFTDSKGTGGESLSLGNGRRRGGTGSGVGAPPFGFSGERAPAGTMRKNGLS